MGTSSKPLISFTSVPKMNQALAAEIRALVQGQQSSTLPHKSDHEELDQTQLKSLLARLYTLICDFRRFRGSGATPDKKILEIWETFFAPIEALAEVRPHGHMIAARMILYLTKAFSSNWQLSNKFPLSDSSARPIAMRCNLLIALDDVLLSHLSHIWSHGDKRDMFPWVFIDYEIDDYRLEQEALEYLDPGLSAQALAEQRRSECIKAACVTRPSDLTPENGVRFTWRWTRRQGDNTVYPLHPCHTRAGYGSFTSTADSPQLLMWQDIGRRGPTHSVYSYDVVDEDTNKNQWRSRPTLRRSRQFVLDAQKIAASNLSRDGRRLAGIAMARSPLPVELQIEVLGYLEDVTEHAYLSKLDLAAVYRPFPVISGKCSECPGLGNSAAVRMMKATCPHKSITLWSLPLRLFHTFHRNNHGTWVLCIHDDCSGHHREASRTGPSQDTELEDYLDGVLQGRCGPGTTVKSIGLGPFDPVELPTEEEDRIRQQRLYSEGCQDTDEERDAREEALWTGLGGLVDVMLHGRTLTSRHTVGSATTEPCWMMGRTRQDEQRVRSALMDIHTRCHYC